MLKLLKTQDDLSKFCVFYWYWNQAPLNMKRVSSEQFFKLCPVPQLTNIYRDQSSTYPNACPALHWGRHRLSSAFGACPALMAVIIFTTSCHVFAVSMWDQLWLANIWNCWCEVLVRSSVWDCVCVGSTLALIMLFKNELVPGSHIDAQDLHNKYCFVLRTLTCKVVIPHIMI